MPLKKPTRKRRPAGARDKRDRKKRFRRKFCKLCADRVNLDYKDVARLQRFITEKGKIISRRMSGNCSRCQRRLAAAIKQARQMAMVPGMMR